MKTISVSVLLFLLTGCPEPEPQVDPLEAAAAEKCPAVHLDRLDTDWVHESGDPKTRLRISKEGDGYKAYYIGGLFGAIELEGKRREKDIRFEEVPTALKLRFEAKGQEKRRTVLFVEPSYKTCALNVYQGATNGTAEQVSPNATEFLKFPGTGGVVFSYEPFDEGLFVGEAATKKDVADKQIEEAGAPLPAVEGGEAVPSGMWSNVAADGDPACTYDMDLYFDDMRQPALGKVAAGKVVGEFRHWTHNWDAKYSGNHTFQFYRYRTCDGGKRERIAIAGIEAILQ